MQKTPLPSKLSKFFGKAKKIILSIPDFHHTGLEHLEKDIPCRDHLVTVIDMGKEMTSNIFIGKHVFESMAGLVLAVPMATYLAVDRIIDGKETRRERALHQTPISQRELSI